MTPTTSTSTRARVASGPRVSRRTPDGWEDRPYGAFEVAPLAPTIGAEVSGIDLSRPLTEAVRAELHRALLEWKVLFFRDQHITRAQQATFARHWGGLEQHPFATRTASFAAAQDDDAPDVVRLAKDATAKGRENVWHADTTWREEPSMGAVLRAVEVPPLGGDTLFADMAAAYDGLDDATKARIEGLVAVHDWVTTFGRAMSAEERDELRPHFPPVEHPVVRRHPETGRATLFVNVAFTQHIVGLAPAESTELLDLLYHQAGYPEYQCRFRWTPGAVAFWDNRAAQHYAASDYFPQRRVMERVSILGDRPV